jgi:membrane protease YdiL (CAAX protease family)
METPEKFETPEFNTAEAPLVVETPVVHPGGWPGAPVPVAPKHGVFVGPFGLRAGWGMALYVIFFVVFSALIGIGALAATGKLKPMIQQKMAERLARQNHTAPPPAPKTAPTPNVGQTPGQQVMTPKGTILNEALSFAALLLAAWVMSAIERRRLAVYGIGRNRLMDFLPGAFWGFAALSLLVLILKSMGLLFFDARLLSGGAIVVFGAKWMLAFLFVGLLEEYMLRGYLQYTLTRGCYSTSSGRNEYEKRKIAFWVAATIMSILFGAMHLGNTGENAFGISQVVLIGLVFSYALWRTGSLWWAIGFHMAWDWAQSFLYGVADSGNISTGRLFQTHIAGKPLLSGGIDGPEGSLFCIPVILLVIVIIRYTTSVGVQPRLEQEPERVVVV